MRLVITGGTGLIGRALAASLVSSGEEVLVTSRDPSRVDGLAAGVEVAVWDSEGSGGLVPLIEGADAVVHLVGEGIAAGRWTEERKRRIRDSRVRSTAAVADAFALASDRPWVLLQGSAVGYYGSREDEDLDEGSAPGTGFLAEVCRDWERAGRSVEALGVRRAVLRTGVVLARNGGALPRMVLPFRLFAGGPVGKGLQWVPWIHLADEVGAIRFLLADESAMGAFNLAAPESATSRSLARAIGRAMRRPSSMPTPAFVMRLALGEMAELLLGSQKVRPEALSRRGYRFRFPALDAALEDLLE